MNTVDFWFLKLLKAPFAVAAVLIFCATTATAGPVEADSDKQPAELILTVSDQWSAFDTTDSRQQPRRVAVGGLFDASRGATLKARPVKVGCGVDVNQFPSEDNSLRSRFVGECNLNYRY